MLILRPQAPRNLAITLIVIGTFALIVACAQYWTYVRRLSPARAYKPWSLVFIVGCLIALLGLLMLGSIVSNAGPFDRRLTCETSAALHARAPRRRVSRRVLHGECAAPRGQTGPCGCDVVQDGQLATKEGREKLATSSIEVHDTYELAFLESTTREPLLEGAARAPDPDTASRGRAAERERLTLVLFAHGWQNDARLCNGNACCFRSLLARIANDAKQAEARSDGAIRPSRTMALGIFVGWRGLSATVPPFKGMSFYARKRVAHAVGQGELVEVLSFLDAYQKHLNEGDPSRCRLVILGHSFGGAAVYSAIANVLKSRIVDAKVQSVLGGEPARIAGFGDVVILANPAFEASLYAPLSELIAQYPQFVPTQRPVLVILASESDTTTRVLFKIGRWVGTCPDDGAAIVASDAHHDGRQLRPVRDPSRRADQGDEGRRGAR